MIRAGFPRIYGTPHPPHFPAYTGHPTLLISRIYGTPIQVVRQVVKEQVVVATTPVDKSTGNKTRENTSPVLSPLASTGLSGHSWRLFPRSPRPPSARPIPSSCARQPKTPRAWSYRLPARGELASNAVLRSSLAKRGDWRRHRDRSAWRRPAPPLGRSPAGSRVRARRPRCRSSASRPNGPRPASRSRARPPDGRPLPDLRPRHPRHRLPAPERLGAVLTHWIIPKLSIDFQ